jgi:hypothetical protein
MHIHGGDLSFLPLGAIKPEGWLKRQLQIQRDGLTGHLDEFWPDVARSGWIGGDAEGWERGPYWLDGALPLAYLLEDAEMIAKVRHWVEQILQSQRADGWLGPLEDQRYGYLYDPWPVFVALKALVQHSEATGDPRVSAAMSRFFHRLDVLLEEQPLQKWGQYRWGECLLSVLWLHSQTGEARLMDLAQKLHEQGFDWGAFFADYPYITKRRGEECVLSSHVVNNAMAVKYPALWSLVSEDPAHRIMSERMIEALDRWHGQATGLFTGDEHVAGRSPSQGTELCAVVEYMYSLEHLCAITGNVAYADRLERIAYNALPAAFKPDMWAHQYDQQANQAICRVSEERVYTNNGPDANIFGLEPHYGCCTANMHQGWPKLVSSLWMRNPDGLTAMAYGSCRVDTKVGGAAVRLRVETSYPFEENVKITVDTDSRLRTTLRLRIPSWCDRPALRIDGRETQVADAGHYAILSREWQGGEVLELSLPSDPIFERRYNNSVAVVRGPLVFALKVPERWEQINSDMPGRELPHADWEVYPDGPWNFAVGLDRKGPVAGLMVASSPPGDRPFSPEGAPLVVRARGRRLSGWKLDHAAAASPPRSPVVPESLAGDESELTLLPYGCTNLRVTELPWYWRS